MISRAQSLIELERLSGEADSTGTAESVFRLLHGAPPDPIIDVCTAALRRYRPSAPNPGFDQLLSDPRTWVDNKGRAVPDDSEDSGPGDASFVAALDGLLMAVAFPTQKRRFTIAACVALRGAAQARAAQAWEIADPEAVQMWRELNSDDDRIDRATDLVRQLSTRKLDATPAALDAARDAWRLIVADLRAAGIDHQPPPDEAEVEADLGYWREIEYLLMPAYTPDAIAPASLFVAIETDDLSTLGSLLHLGADVNVKKPTPPHWSPLHEAIERLAQGGPIEPLVLLLRHKPDVEGGGGEPPLLMALRHGQSRAVDLLLAAGADPSARGMNGDSPLRLCAERGDVATAAMLLRCGAMSTIDEPAGALGMSALGTAVQRLDLPLISRLLGWTANPEAPDAHGMTAFDRLPPRTAQNGEARDSAEAMLRGAMG